MDFTNYILPELLILVPVLYILGLFFKRTKLVSDRICPLMVGLAGIIMAVLYTLSTMEIGGFRDGCTAAFTALVQGILCAGGANYVNQLIKQGCNKNK